MRLFFSFPLPAPILEAFVAFQNELRSKAPTAPLRWTDPAKLHITSLFLGEIQDNKVASLIARTTQVLQNLQEVEIKTQNLTFFPNLRRPSTFVLMLDGGKEIQTLYSALQEAAKTLCQA